MGGGFGKVFRLGSTPVNFNAQGHWNLASPEAGPDRQARFTMQFVYPQGAPPKK